MIRELFLESQVTAERRMLRKDRSESQDGVCSFGVRCTRVLCEVVPEVALFRVC